MGRTPRPSRSRAANRDRSTPSTASDRRRWRFSTIDGSVVYRKEELEALGENDFALEQPWVLAWFGEATPWRKPWLPTVAQTNGEDENDEFRKPRPTEMPILFRLERRPTAIRQDGNGIRFEFKDKVGKLAVMPAMGAHITDPELSEVWRRMPRPPLRKNAYTWSDVLRDYPLSVTETVEVDMAKDHVTFGQSFKWLAFQDKAFRDVTERDRYAPLPPMLATAIGSQSDTTGNASVFGGPTEVDANFNFLSVRNDAPKGAGLQLTVWRGDKLDEQIDGLLDGNLMDTPGQVRLVEGGDYAFRIGRLTQYLDAEQPRVAADDSPTTRAWRDKLNAHVAGLIDADGAIPRRVLEAGRWGNGQSIILFDGPNAADLTATLHRAWPHLSKELRGRAKAYLIADWKRYPPWDFDPLHSRKAGGNLVGRHGKEAVGIAGLYDMTRRENCQFGDLYGMAAYHALVGELPKRDSVRTTARKIANRLIAHQDWALMLPNHSREYGLPGFVVGSYFDRIGPERVNGWLKGAIGLARLAKAYGWAEEEQLAWQLFAKLAVARIGMAKYPTEQHLTGVLQGRPIDEPRALTHIDKRGGHLGLFSSRAPVGARELVHLEHSPFIDLTPEVGRLLFEHAQESTQTWLNHRDRTTPQWWKHDKNAPFRAGGPRAVAGNVLAQAWVLGKRGAAFEKYLAGPIDKHDVRYIELLVAAIEGATPVEATGVDD